MRLPLLAELPPPPPGKTGWPWTVGSPLLGGSPSGGHSWPRISIVTPSYNQGEFLEETIRSVLLQGYPDLEYIVMDGGSDDGSVAVLERYSPWLTHWESRRDAGQPDAINRGLERTTGRFVAWVNSDDYYLPGAFAAVARHLPEFGDESFWLATAVEHRGEADGGFTRVEQPVYVSPAQLLPFDRYVQAAGVFWDHDFLRRAGTMRRELHYAFDKEYWLRLLSRGFRFRADNAIVSAVYRFHDSSKSISARPGFRYEWAKIALEYADAAALDSAARAELRRQLSFNAARVAQDVKLPRRQRARALVDGLRNDPAAILRRDWRGGARALLRRRA